MENMDLERFADLLRRMIEKYAEKIDWDSLPDPPEPSTDEVDGFFLLGNIRVLLVLSTEKKYNKYIHLYHVQTDKE